VPLESRDCFSHPAFIQQYQIPIKMPHVTFGESSPARKSYEEKRTIIKLPAKTDDDNNNKKTVVRQSSRTISYKIPDETRKTKPAEKICVERRITYKDLDGNVVKIVYEDECGKVIRTIYPTLPPAPTPPKCSPPPSSSSSSSSSKCSSPAVSEPSNIPSEDLRNCNWTKIVVKNSRGVVWKIVHVDCDGKTMKTEYPEAAPRKKRSIETRRYVVKEMNDDGPVRKVVIQKESRESVPSVSSEATKTTEKDVEVRLAVKSASGSGSSVSASTKESDVQSSQRSGTESTATRRDSADSSGGRRKTFESAEEVVKDENGVVKRVTYTDSRGRRRTVVYED
jgi:uncharacterized lipoprotein YehR (DUF1307 family)